MVGDGVDDVLALTRADVGMAIDSGADIVVKSADTILVQNNPNPVHLDVEINSGQVLLAEIEKSGEIPHSENGRFYQRRGSESRKLNGVDLRQFVEERQSDLPSE